LIKVGYVPYSEDLTHPGDRRRISVWASTSNNPLILNESNDCELLVLSNNANFGYWLKWAKQPVVLDLVDGYLGESPNFYRDFARNLIRTFRGKSNLSWITYTRHLKYACRNSDAIIVASPEQKEGLSKYNKNIYVISDDHSEVLEASRSSRKEELSNTEVGPSRYIFWEGFGFTLKHFRDIARDLDKFLSYNQWGMYLLTEKEFPRWGGYIGKINTDRFIKKLFPLSGERIQVIPWSLYNLAHYANKSSFAVIPVSAKDKFAQLKSENKLLSMWSLGLVTLCSHNPAYLRTMTKAKQEANCFNNQEFLSTLSRVNSELHLLPEMRNQIYLYIHENHKKEKIVEQWNNVFFSLLDRNN